MIINLHGTVKPAGERRTYPNALTREAVGGAEGYAVSDWRDPNDYGGGSYPWGGDLTAANNCVIPFTRGAVGPLDYTPMASFGALNNVRFGPTDPDTGKPQEFDNPPLFTLAHMYALAIIYESGIQCLADKPSVYKDVYKRQDQNFCAKVQERRKEHEQKSMAICAFFVAGLYACIYQWTFRIRSNYGKPCRSSRNSCRVSQRYGMGIR